MSMLLLILGRLHRWAPEPASVPRGWPYTQSACTRYAQRNVTSELTPVLNCADSGQAIADNVRCAFSIITESFPEQKVLHKRDYSYGGFGTFIQRGDPKIWTFPLEDFN